MVEHAERVKDGDGAMTLLEFLTAAAWTWFVAAWFFAHMPSLPDGSGIPPPSELLTWRFCKQRGNVFGPLLPHLRGLFIRIDLASVQNVTPPRSGQVSSVTSSKRASECSPGAVAATWLQESLLRGVEFSARDVGSGSFAASHQRLQTTQCSRSSLQGQSLVYCLDSTVRDWHLVGSTYIFRCAKRGFPTVHRCQSSVFGNLELKTRRESSSTDISDTA